MKRMIAPLVATFALAAPLYAADLVPVGNAGAWQIFTDPNHDGNCGAQVQYDDGSFLRMGYLDKAKKAYIVTVAPGWNEFKLDHKYQVSYQIDDQVAVLEDAVGRRIGDMPGVEIEFDAGDFLGTLVTGKVLTFSAEGNTVVQQSLDGSADAIAAATVCEAALKG